MLHPFIEEEVFPERADVVSQVSRSEGADERVSDAGIEEIYFSKFPEFGANVSTEGREAIDDEGLFEESNISFDRRFGGLEGVGELLVGDFFPDLESERLQELLEKLGVFHGLMFERVFVERASDEILDGELRFAGSCHHVRIQTENNAVGEKPVLFLFIPMR